MMENENAQSRVKFAKLVKESMTEQLKEIVQSSSEFSWSPQLDESLVIEVQVKFLRGMVSKDGKGKGPHLLVKYIDGGEIVDQVSVPAIYVYSQHESIVKSKAKRVAHRFLTKANELNLIC